MTLGLRAKSNCLPIGWGDEDDARLRATKGKYANIAGMSDRLGVSETALIKRWHLVRNQREAAAADTAEVPRDQRFEELLGVVTPSMRAVCGALNESGPMSAATLAVRLGLHRARIAELIQTNGARMAAIGWVVGRVAGPRMGRYVLIYTGEGVE